MKTNHEYTIRPRFRDSAMESVADIVIESSGNYTPAEAMDFALAVMDKARSVGVTFQNPRAS